MATQRPITPSASYNPVPSIEDPSHISRGYGNPANADVGVNDFAGAQHDRSRLGRFEEDFDARTRGSSVIDGDMPMRSSSRSSTLNQGTTPSRSGTLKKKGSVKRTGSLKRSGSRKSMHAGSIRGVTIDDQERGYDREDSVFYTPVPTKGSPTEVLAERFQSRLAYVAELGISLTCDSLAKVSQRSHHLLPRSSIFLRTPREVPPQGVKCDQQHQCARGSADRRRSQRRQPHPPRFSQASHRRGKQSPRC
jgi:hypothetical protein